MGGMKGYFFKANPSRGRHQVLGDQGGSKAIVGAREIFFDPSVTTHSQHSITQRAHTPMPGNVR